MSDQALPEYDVFLQFTVEATSEDQAIELACEIIRKASRKKDKFLENSIEVFKVEEREDEDDYDYEDE